MKIFKYILIEYKIPNYRTHLKYKENSVSL